MEGNVVLIVGWKEPNPNNERVVKPGKCSFQYSYGCVKDGKICCELSAKMWWCAQHDRVVCDWLAARCQVDCSLFIVQVLLCISADVVKATGYSSAFSGQHSRVTGSSCRSCRYRISLDSDVDRVTPTCILFEKSTRQSFTCDLR